MKGLDIWTLRNQVFDLFGFAELNEPSFRTLIKAHLIFLMDDSSEKLFETQVRDLRQAH